MGAIEINQCWGFRVQDLGFRAFGSKVCECSRTFAGGQLPLQEPYRRSIYLIEAFSRPIYPKLLTCSFL